MNKQFNGGTSVFTQSLLVHGWTCRGSSSFANACNTNPQANGTQVVVNATGSEPAYLNIATTTNQNTQAALVDNGADGNVNPQGFPFTIATLSFSFFTIKMTGVTGRLWIGFSDAAGQAGTMFADNPAQNYCAFRFSQQAGDLTIKAICATGAANQTIADTGIVPDTNRHIYKIVPTGNNGQLVQFFIDGNLVATVGTNVPAVTVEMRNCISIDTFSGVALAISSVSVANSFWVTNI